MKKEPNKKLIGFFILFSFALLITLISKNMFENYITNKYNLVVLYFSESIKGLSVGSPVMYEGVQVGKVVKIEIQTDPKTLDFSIPVYVRFAEDEDFSHMEFGKDSAEREWLNYLIRKGLRARLTNQNFLTGQLMIQLFMDDSAPIIYHMEAQGRKRMVEIPTTLSTIGNLTRDIQDLPLKQIVLHFDNVLHVLENDLPKLIETYTQTGETLNTELPKLFQSYAQAANRLNTYIDKSTPQTNQSLNQLNQTLKDISSASKSLQNLADYLERHPDSIIKGKKE